MSFSNRSLLRPPGPGAAAVLVFGHNILVGGITIRQARSFEKNPGASPKTPTQLYQPGSVLYELVPPDFEFRGGGADEDGRRCPKLTTKIFDNLGFAPEVKRQRV